MTLVKWKNRMQPGFPGLLEDFFNNDFGMLSQGMLKTVPAVNIRETDSDFRVEVVAPGFDRKDFRVEVENDQLKIAGSKETSEEPREEHYTRKEFTSASFERYFTLPDVVDAEKIAARYENGILQLTIPRKEEAKAKPVKQIKVS